MHFGDSSRYFPQPRIDRVFDEVEKGSVDWGVVPVENSLEGSVNITLDRLITTPLKIRAEIYLRISQCLISSAKSIKDIKKIYSHPAGLGSVSDVAQNQFAQLHTGRNGKHSRGGANGAGEKE